MRRLGAMPGPPPNPNRRRRNVGPQLLELPSEGRQGAAPKWPLEDQTPAERAIWVDLWGLPQAVMWERLRWTRTVARYVRTLVRAEEPVPTRDALTEARQLEEHLGLTPKAMKSLLWKVADDEVGARRAPAPAGESRRLRAVDPAAAG